MVFGDSLRPRKFIPRNLLILSNLLTKAISLTTTKLRKLLTKAVFKQFTKFLTHENFLPYGMLIEPFKRRAGLCRYVNDFELLINTRMLTDLKTVMVPKRY